MELKDWSKVEFLKEVADSEKAEAMAKELACQLQKLAKALGDIEEFKNILDSGRTPEGL